MKVRTVTLGALALGWSDRALIGAAVLCVLIAPGMLVAGMDFEGVRQCVEAAHACIQFFRQRFGFIRWVFCISVNIKLDLYCR